MSAVGSYYINFTNNDSVGIALDIVVKEIYLSVLE